MARTLATYVAVYLLAVNFGFTLVNLLDRNFVTSTFGAGINPNNQSLFGVRVEPYADYNVVQDAGNQTIMMNNTASLSNATNRIMAYGPSQGVLDQYGFWSITKASVLMIINLLFGGFLGLPTFVASTAPELFNFLSPFFILLGIIQIVGIYEIIRGTSL